ncbi:MAG: phosphoribosylanthranilate isomerase [Opitutales bacterium]
MKPPKVKVCGITRAEDAEFALAEGADCLGFILYDKSPRKVTLSQAQALFADAKVPEAKRVVVDVSPDSQRLTNWKNGGFSLFQLHFPHDLSRERIYEWVQLVGSENLWLAPKLPLGEPFPEDLTDLADNFLIDGYSSGAYGGTGQTADWARFAEWKSLWPHKGWILAGGLSPANISEALTVSGADRVDANSGVESAPGIKDPAEVRAFFTSLRAT